MKISYDEKMKGLFFFVKHGVELVSICIQGVVLSDSALSCNWYHNVMYFSSTIHTYAALH